MAEKGSQANHSSPMVAAPNQAGVGAAEWPRWLGPDRGRAAKARVLAAIQRAKQVGRL
jgi:hypothetical protein